MFKRKVIISLGLCLLVALFANKAFSGFGGGDFGGGGMMMGGEFDPEAMRQMQEDRMRDQIGATEEQWKEMGPIVMKIQQLTQQLAIFSSRRMGGMMMPMGGGMGGFGGPQGNAGNVGGTPVVRTAMGGPGGGMGGPGGGMGFGGMMGMGMGEPTPLSEAVNALRTTLQDTAAKADTIKEQLEKVRAERKKVEDELKAEREKLTKIVASRQNQEAQLVLMGILL